MIKRITGGERKAIWCRASLTVEASLITPFITLAFLYFIYFFILIQMQQKIQTSMNETAKFFAKHAMFYEHIADDVGEVKNEAIEGVIQKYNIQGKTIELLYKAKLCNELEKNHLNMSYIQGGLAGIHVYAHKDYLGDKSVDFSVYYKFKFPVGLLLARNFSCMQRTHMSCWTGTPAEKRFQNDSSEIGDKVFITETGTKYHLYDDCSYLKLSVYEIQSSAIGEVRNKFNHVYTPCHLCTKEDYLMVEKVYVTEDGDRYHIDRGCRGLKRSIRVVERSEVEDKMTCCSRCAKRGESK